MTRGASIDTRHVVIRFIDVDDDRRMALPVLRTSAYVDSPEFGPFPLVGASGWSFRTSRCCPLPERRPRPNRIVRILRQSAR
jgi:hypothetical protein